MGQGGCRYAYRKGGSDAAHCRLQTGNGRKWDFCAFQYFCGQTRRYEVSDGAKTCKLPAKEAEKQPENTNF